MSAPTARPLPPGPKGHPILGSALGFRNDPIATFSAAWREYGDLVRFRGPVKPYLVAHPDYLKHILVDAVDNYPHPDDFNAKISVSVGKGLVTSEGDVWRQQRRMVAPSFRREPLERFAGVMADAAERMLDRWEQAGAQGRELDARAEMQNLTLEILAACLFQADWSADATAMGDAVAVQLEHLNRKLIAVVDLPEKVPTPANRRFLAARNLLDRTVFALIEQRRKSEVPQDDLLSMLMAAEDPDGGGMMTDRQLRDQVMTLFVAGHETVASTLSWMCYVMSKHPGETEQARAEVQAVLGGRKPTKDDLPQLKYLKLYISEVLRLYPPLWQVARMPIKEDVIGGYRIPARSFMLLSTYLTHRHPEFWENPEGFDPGRFTKERSADRPRYAYVPYVGGPRNCVGLAFANMELTIVAASILQRFRLDVAPGHPIVMQPDISLRAKHGIRMKVRPATATPAASTPATSTPSPSTSSSTKEKADHVCEHARAVQG